MAETTTTDTPTIGAVIRAWRRDRGLNVTQLAERAGVSKGYLSVIEHDRRTNPWLGHLEKLAAALEISLQDIQDRRLPPGYDDQSLGQGPPPGMTQAPQQPPVAVGAVLQQLLEQMQILTAAVSQLQAELAALKPRGAVPLPTPRAPPEDAALAEPAVGVLPVSGEWQGRAWHHLPQGTPLTISSESGAPIVVPHGMTFLFAVGLQLHSAGDARLKGSGMLSIEQWPVGGELIKSSNMMSITGGTAEDSQITLTLQGYAGETRLEMKGTLSGDSRLITGQYEAEGLLTEQHVWDGEFFLQKKEPVW